MLEYMRGCTSWEKTWGWPLLNKREVVVVVDSHGRRPRKKKQRGVAKRRPRPRGRRERIALHCMHAGHAPRTRDTCAPHRAGGRGPGVGPAGATRPPPQRDVARRRPRVRSAGPLHAAASPAPRIRDRFARARRAEPFEFARCAPVESNTGGIGLPNQGLRASIIDVSVRK